MITDILKPKSAKEINNILSTFDTRKLIELWVSNPSAFPQLYIKIFERPDYVDEFDEEDIADFLYAFNTTPQESLIKEKLLPVIIKYLTDNLDDFEIKEKNNKYYLHFDWWDSFYIFFGANKKIIQQILGGYAYDVFYYDRHDYEYDNVLNYDLKNSFQVPSLKTTALEELKDEELISEFKKLTSFSSIFQFIIDNDDDFPNIMHAINTSIEDVQRMADEAAAYTDLTDIIKRHLIDWKQTKNDKLVATISKETIWLLWGIYNDEDSFNYNENNWYGDISDFPDDFKDRLECALSDL